MPKRSAEEKIVHYERKIRKLRKRYYRNQIDSSDSSDTEGVLNADNPRQRPTNAENDPGNDVRWSPAPSLVVPEPIPGTEVIIETLEPENCSETMLNKTTDLVPEVVPVEQLSNAEAADQTLDPEILEALGESTSDTPDFGPKIHENLAKLWLPILTKGLTKENREKILKEYLIPENCRLLQAPNLNAEISAAVPDSTRNRDKILVTHQQQLGGGITAVNRALDILLSGEDRKSVIHHLSNACRLLSDLHSTNTHSRIKLITPNLDKNFLHIVQDSVRDDTLFGNKLPEKIKAAKAIERQGQQIKKTHPRATSSHLNNNRSCNNPGNWSGPPRYAPNHGNRGGRKTTTQSRRPYLNPTQQQSAPKHTTANKPRAPAPQ